MTQRLTGKISYRHPSSPCCNVSIAQYEHPQLNNTLSIKVPVPDWLDIGADLVGVHVTVEMTTGGYTGWKIIEAHVASLSEKGLTSKMVATLDELQPEQPKQPLQPYVNYNGLEIGKFYMYTDGGGTHGPYLICRGINGQKMLRRGPTNDLEVIRAQNSHCWIETTGKKFGTGVISLDDCKLGHFYILVESLVNYPTQYKPWLIRKSDDGIRGVLRQGCKAGARGLRLNPVGTQWVEVSGDHW